MKKTKHIATGRKLVNSEKEFEAAATLFACILGGAIIILIALAMGQNLITNNNMKYLINVTIYNTYEIESSSIEEAKEQLTNMSNEEILNDCDFNIIDVEEAQYNTLSPCTRNRHSEALQGLTISI